MTYPNITDPKTRQRIVRRILRVRKEIQASRKNKDHTAAALNRMYLLGLRHGLDY